jgi:GTPase SAR1 family protein
MFNLLKSKKNTPKPDSNFSRFFVESSSREKKKVFSKAARMANEEQRKLFDAKEITEAK